MYLEQTLNKVTQLFSGQTPPDSYQLPSQPELLSESMIIERDFLGSNEVINQTQRLLQENILCEPSSEDLSSESLTDGEEGAGSKKFKCDISNCSKAFSQVNRLEKHQNKKHQRSTLYHCTFEGCTKVFGEKGNLQVHQRIHSGNKPYKCQFCSKTFSSSGNCNDHQRRHNNQKPYSCALCEQEYYRRYQVVKHITRQHKGQDPYSFVKKAQHAFAPMAPPTTTQLHQQESHVGKRRSDKANRKFHQNLKYGLLDQSNAFSEGGRNFYETQQENFPASLKSQSLESPPLPSLSSRHHTPAPDNSQYLISTLNEKNAKQVRNYNKRNLQKCDRQAMDLLLQQQQLLEGELQLQKQTGSQILSLASQQAQRNNSRWAGESNFENDINCTENPANQHIDDKLLQISKQLIQDSQLFETFKKESSSGLANPQAHSNPSNYLEVSLPCLPPQGSFTRQYELCPMVKSVESLIREAEDQGPVDFYLKREEKSRDENMRGEAYSCCHISSNKLDVNPPYGVAASDSLTNQGQSKLAQLQGFQGELQFAEGAQFDSLLIDCLPGIPPKKQGWRQNTPDLEANYYRIQENQEPSAINLALKSEITDEQRFNHEGYSKQLTVNKTEQHYNNIYQGRPSNPQQLQSELPHSQSQNLKKQGGREQEICSQLSHYHQLPPQQQISTTTYSNVPLEHGNEDVSTFRLPHNKQTHSKDQYSQLVQQVEKQPSSHFSRARGYCQLRDFAAGEGCSSSQANQEWFVNSGAASSNVSNAQNSQNQEPNFLIQDQVAKFRSAWPYENSISVQQKSNSTAGFEKERAMDSRRINAELQEGQRGKLTQQSEKVAQDLTISGDIYNSWDGYLNRQAIQYSNTLKTTNALINNHETQEAFSKSFNLDFQEMPLHESFLRGDKVTDGLSPYKRFRSEQKSSDWVGQSHRMTSIDCTQQGSSNLHRFKTMTQSRPQQRVSDNVNNKCSKPIDFDLQDYFQSFTTNPLNITEEEIQEIILDNSSNLEKHMRVEKIETILLEMYMRGGKQ